MSLFTIIAPAIGAIVLTLTSPTWLTPMQQLGLLAYPLFFFTTTILAGLSLAPTHAFSLVAGMLFGHIHGPIAALISIVGASLFGYIIMTCLVGKKALIALAQNPKAERVHRELLQHNGFQTILLISLIRLSPVMPFAATNLILAASNVKLAHFLIGGTIGLAPRIILVAIAGASLVTLDLSKSSDQTLLILGGFATLLALALGGKMARKALKSGSSLKFNPSQSE